MPNCSRLKHARKMPFMIIETHPVIRHHKGMKNAYIHRNYNPYGKIVGDCVIRAVSTVLGESWDDTYWGIAEEGFTIKDMPSSNDVWGAYLIRNGYVRRTLPDTCPMCYTVKDFCDEHPLGRYVLATGTHAIAVINGEYIDTWDSGDLTPMYYFERRR